MSAKKSFYFLVLISVICFDNGVTKSYKAVVFMHGIFGDVAVESQELDAWIKQVGFTCISWLNYIKIHLSSRKLYFVLFLLSWVQ